MRCIRSCGIGGSRSRAAARYSSGGMRRFFAHSISVARSPAGRNLNGAGSAFAIWRSANAFDGRILPDLARARSGAAGASAAEWNVLARTP